MRKLKICEHISLDGVIQHSAETKADTEFARAFDSINKIVFSRSLDGAEDRNTRIVRTNLRDENA
jgi:hypothetical protein